MKNPKNIPKKRFEKLLTLIEFLKNRRVEIYTKHKSKHYALLLTKNFDIVSFGENHFRKVPKTMSVHAEKQCILNSSRSFLKRNKSYYLFVTKLSPREGYCSSSCCCIRCKNYLLHCPLKISRIYYTNENGITFQNIQDIPTYFTEKDRRKIGVI